MVRLTTLNLGRFVWRYDARHAVEVKVEGKRSATWARGLISRYYINNNRAY